MWSIHTNIQTAVATMVLVGAVLGSVAAGPMGTKLGRRSGLFAVGSTAIVGVILQLVYPHLALLLLGRISQGSMFKLVARTVKQ